MRYVDLVKHKSPESINNENIYITLKFNGMDASLNLQTDTLMFSGFQLS